MHVVYKEIEVTYILHYINPTVLIGYAHIFVNIIQKLLEKRLDVPEIFEATIDIMGLFFETFRHLNGLSYAHHYSNKTKFRIRTCKVSSLIQHYACTCHDIWDLFNPGMVLSTWVLQTLFSFKFTVNQHQIFCFLTMASDFLDAQ